ncbi:MAG TPA: TlpA disulfide reductase family protein [Candidatus Dormibacteraeota bacterium]|nr:TlpA disulfide reductase family protein [Candidatus Dormibacteraeota bacterium]
MTRRLDRGRLRTLASLSLLLPAFLSCVGANEGVAATVPVVAPAVREDPYAKISLQDPQGRIIRFSDFKGKVRLIDVWASWCGPCRMTIPDLNRLYDRYRGQGLVVVGVSVDSSPAEVVAFTRKTPLKYPVGMMNSEIGTLLGNPDALPTTFLVDRTGRLRRKFIGYVELATIEREVRKFLETR